MRYLYYSKLRIISVLLSITGILFFYPFTKSGEKLPLKDNVQFIENNSLDIDKPNKKKRNLHCISKKVKMKDIDGKNIRSLPAAEYNSALSSDNQGAKNSRKKKRRSLQINSFNSPAPQDQKFSSSVINVKLSEIADYDTIRDDYTLKRCNLYETKEMSKNLLSLLKILNRKDMPPNYYRWQEYINAYGEIDFFYHDTYIWPYFTNNKAKINFFLFLFAQYAADNQSWRPYEKHKSDCSQFSQRVYLYLSPDEIYMPDKDYFLFLFSDYKSRSERKKLCNKIPNVYYTIISPYAFQKDRHKDMPDPHAMISFAPDDNQKNLILCEPQNGNYEFFQEYIGDIVVEKYDRYPFICYLDKIVSIEGSRYHEARTNKMGVYFFPQAVFNDIKYKDPRLEYGKTPVLIKDYTARFHHLISGYIDQVLDYQPVDHVEFIGTIERNIKSAKVPFQEIEKALKSSLDIIMYGLFELERKDFKRLKSDINDLNDFADMVEYQGDQEFRFLPQTKEFLKALNYLFLLRCKPFLESV